MLNRINQIIHINITNQLFILFFLIQSMFNNIITSAHHKIAVLDNVNNIASTQIPTKIRFIISFDFNLQKLDRNFIFVLNNSKTIGKKATKKYP